MKICFLGDTHLDYNLNFVPYFEKFYSNIFFPELEKRNISTIVQFGDIFDSRKKTDIVAMLEAKRYFFQECKERNIKLITLLGNHDIVYKNTLEYNSPKLLLQEFDNICIIDKPTIFPEFNALIIPWICSDNEQQIMDAIEKTSMARLFGHLELSGFEMNRGYIMEHGYDSNLFKKFDQVFSGHYHTKSSKGNVTYLGTPYELTFSDANDPKGFYIFETETGELEFVQNPYNMFHVIRYNNGTECDINKLTNCIIKLIIENKDDQLKYDKFRQELEKIDYFDLKVIETFDEFDSEKIDIDKIDLSDTMIFLAKYVDEVEGNFDKESIKSILKELYVDAINFSNEDE